MHSCMHLAAAQCTRDDDHIAHLGSVDRHQHPCHSHAPTELRSPGSALVIILKLERNHSTPQSPNAPTLPEPQARPATCTSAPARLVGHCALCMQHAPCRKSLVCFDDDDDRGQRQNVQSRGLCEGSTPATLPKQSTSAGAQLTESLPPRMIRGRGKSVKTDETVRYQETPRLLSTRVRSRKVMK